MVCRLLKKAAPLGVTTSGLALATALCPVAALAQASDEVGGLEEIIVTAQKREQSLQDVPVAVTALTTEALEANRITTVNDLSSIAPGVTVRPSAGGSQIPAFVIRGQQSYGVVAGSDKQVSIYLDGVYISSPRGSIFDLPDVQRIEVLRGPQGTLFGRNATAGAISVATRDPTGEAHVKAQASIGNYDSYRFRVSADLPQIGPFSGYFSFMRNYQRGPIENAGAGTIWDRTLSTDPYFAKVRRSPRWLGTVDSNSYFAAVKFEPSDSFKTVYKYDRNEDNGTPEGTAFIGGYSPTFPALGSGAALVGPIILALYNSQNIYQNDSAEAPDIVNNGFAIPRTLRVEGHSLTSTWQASDNITVKNIAAYRKSRIFGVSAIDGLSNLTFTQDALVPFATLSAVSTLGAGFFALTPEQQGATIGQFAAGLQPFVGGRMLLTGSGASSLTKQWSDELQVNYSSDALQVTVGALWFHSKDEAGGPEGMRNTTSLTLPPLPASGVVPLGNEGRYFNKATSLAAYLQAEYKITPTLELVLGGRITRDKKTSRFVWDIDGVPQTTIVPEPYKKTKPNYSIGLNWQPNADTLVYGKYSTSFVSGGSVAGIEFEPEVAKSWELGVKADLLDRRLRTNLALFYVDYKNFQGPSSTTSPEAVAFLVATYGDLGNSLSRNLSTFVQQAYDVRAKGFELEITAAPTSGLTLGGNLAYTDPEFLNIDPLFLAAQGGEYVAGARPKWTGAAYASYETPPLFGDSTLVLRADTFYQSKFLFTSNPTVQMSRGVPEAQLAAPGHWKVNARAALKNVDIGGVQAEFAVWGRNLTNTQYRTSTLFLPWGNSATYEPPRTYGADVTIEF